MDVDAALNSVGLNNRTRARAVDLVVDVRLLIYRQPWPVRLGDPLDFVATTTTHLDQPSLPYAQDGAVVYEPPRLA
jgi:hypothetical protein